MSGLFKNLSLASRGLKYKLRIAFSLMSIIPIMSCIYLFIIYGSNISKVPFSNLQIFLFISVSVIIAFMGYSVTKQMVDPIIKISSEAQSIAKGDFNRTIDVHGKDEIGELGSALNMLNKKIRDNMEELKDYGERTKQINSEINKRVVVLSGLLQVSNLITQGASLKEICDFSISKIAQLKNASWVILAISNQYKNFEISAQYGLTDDIQTFLLQKGGINKIYNSVLLNKKGLVINRQSEDVNADELIQIFDTANIIFIPVYYRTKIIGFLGTGNSVSGSKYAEEDLDLIKVFAQQITIGIENDYLSKRVSELEIKDSLTGLYNKGFIVDRLGEEIKRGLIYQRPCAFLLISINKFEDFLKSQGQLTSEEILKKVSKIIEENCSEIDKIARYHDHDFAIVLPERNRKQSIALAEDLRDKINEFFSKRPECNVLTISGAVSENPIDGSDPNELIEKAEKSLESAKREGHAFKV